MCEMSVFRNPGGARRFLIGTGGVVSLAIIVLYAAGLISFDFKSGRKIGGARSAGRSTSKPAGTSLKKAHSRGSTRPAGDFGHQTLIDEERLEEELEEKKHERYDKPGEAAEYFRVKRLAEGEFELPVERYLLAVERIRTLPQYSTVRRRFQPSMNERRLSKEEAASEWWNQLGPGNVGGRTRVLLVNPRNPDIIYAAAAAGGVWKTEDGGRNWRPLTDLLPNLAVNALAFDPSNPDILFAGTGEGFFNYDAARGAGIFRSFDGGESWRRLESTGTPDFHFVNDIVVSHVNRNRIYAATRSGVMRSLDGGESWNKVLDVRAGGCLDLAARTDLPADYIFAACGTEVSSSVPSSVQASIYRNIDAAAGLTAWAEVYSETGMGRTSLAIAPSNQNVIYAVSSESGATGPAHSLHAVFRSAGSGDPGTWQAQVRNSGTITTNTALFTNPIFAFMQACQGENNLFFHQGWYNNAIAVDPRDDNRVWVGGVDLFRSDDGGVSWGLASFWHLKAGDSRYLHADQHAIVFDPRYDGASNRRLFVANDGGIYSTADALATTSMGDRAVCTPQQNTFKWESLNNNYAVTQFYHGTPFPDGTRYLGGTQDNGVVIGSDADGLNGWREILPGDGSFVAVDPYNPSVIYAATTGLTLRKSTDGGRRFYPATTGISNIGFRFMSPFILDPASPDRLWMGGGHMWRSRNGAQTWTMASSQLNGSASAIAVAPTDSNFVVAGTDAGYLHRTTVGLNSDGDSVWPAVRPRAGYVSSVTFDPSNRDIVYATYSTFGGRHVWQSLDGGVTWQSIDGSGQGMLPDIPVNCLVVDPTNTRHLYIGTDLGIFVSLDGGSSWAVESNGFVNTRVESMAVNPYGGVAHLFAFTHGRGVWRAPLGRVCNPRLSTSNQTFGIRGGAGEVSVSAGGGDCSWTVENNTAWITIVGDQSGTGSGVVKFNVDASAESTPRRGIITVGGKTLTVTQAGPVTSVSAASLRTDSLSPDSIVSAFGQGLSTDTRVAGSPLLPIELDGTTVVVTDKTGVERFAGIFFVSPFQVNYLMPAETAEGPASVMIFNSSGDVFNGIVEISRVAPALFTADSSGRGVAVGNALRILADGSQSYEPLAEWNAGQNQFVTRPIDLGGPSDNVYLILYGTGIRFRTDISAVIARIGNTVIPVTYAREQRGFSGLDQVNLLLPKSLAGAGDVDLELIVDGIPANLVRIHIK
ncbi:MAG: hypothetical protein IPM66_04780 [Acidobacteriota bacterium]|nr:MAG: hypothetical protein IPM66_04780 [Acidobacteriota bacterium]